MDYTLPHKPNTVITDYPLKSVWCDNFNNVFLGCKYSTHKYTEFFLCWFIPCCGTYKNLKNGNQFGHWLLCLPVIIANHGIPMCLFPFCLSSIPCYYKNCGYMGYSLLCIPLYGVCQIKNKVFKHCFCVPLY
jgi:hypothetical protein